MPDNNQVIGEIVSCDSLHIAPIIEDSDANYTTGTPEYFAPVGEIKHDPKVNVASSSYDGAIMFNYLTEGVSEDTVTVSGVSEKKKAEVTGKSYDATSGLMYDNGDLIKTPEYALGYRIEIGSGSYIYHWLLKGKFYQSSAMDAKTKGEKIDPQATELTFLPTRTIHKWTVPDPADSGKTISTGLKRTVGDTGDPTFALSDSWFDTVVTPSASAAPAALALSSSNPANNATGALDTVAPILTFNNAIADYDGVTLLKADGTVVNATMSLSIDKKILTITPSASLGAATEYTIVLADITDIYGQKLATQTIKFTTA